MRIRLKLLDRINHYSIVIFFLTPVFLFVFLDIRSFLLGENNSIIIDEPIFLLLPLALASLFYWLQYSRLNYKIVNTLLSHKEIRSRIIKIANKEEWVIRTNRKNTIVAKSNPGFLSGSWGEQITVIINGQNVYVNSICDLDKRASVVSFGRNRANERRIIEAIKQ
ncbi:MAG: hypothetical protein JJ978_12485 [Roseivirga sp.]|uniref:hypothetical protein n=1 Tax=Roseivirga sp. TaxID=1964215 RepID=UPI001B20A4AF|nr:hypothetical protein [Roseivirga sp.]MBO6496380.1 hypothetical protein [Roseivirga sp.]